MSEEGAKRHGLGRGLSALLAEEGDELDRLAPGGVREAPIERLRPSELQPRRRFDPADAAALVASVREHGILQPLVVRPVQAEAGVEAYEIVAGERRWRSAQQAGLHHVPVVVRELSDTAALEAALVENLQRENLTPLEEAEGYRRMIDEFGHTQERLAQTVGRSRSHVANTLRLLALPDGVKTMLNDGRLTAGHARTLVGAEDPARLARTIADRGLNVRQAERLARRIGAAPARAPDAAKSADTVALETDISNALGLPVTIHHKGGGGQVRIAYRSLDQLDEVCRRLAYR